MELAAAFTFGLNVAFLILLAESRVKSWMDGLHRPGATSSDSLGVYKTAKGPDGKTYIVPYKPEDEPQEEKAMAYDRWIHR